MTQAPERVAPKSSLQYISVRGAIKQRAPLFQLANPVRSFLRMQLPHSPVVQRFSAAHRVAEMRSPIVGRIHIRHRRRHPAFGHHRMRFAQQRFAYHANLRALGQRFNRRAKSRAAGADDQYIVFVRFIFWIHRSLISLIAPLATSRTYRSVSPTPTRLTHANNMWRSLRKLSPRHAVCRGVPKAAQEKQSNLPPARCRSEWQDVA